VWIGGPVQPQSGWVVVDDPALRGDGVIEVGDRLRISSSREVFDKLAKQASSKRKRPAKAARRMVMLGYSGWGASQLEGEIARGAWLPVPLDERILFECEPSERWEKAYALVGLTPGNVMSMRSIGEA
jgi:putative transcriptional regulator